MLSSRSLRSCPPVRLAAMSELRALRKQLGLTQQRLADVLGKTRETISEFERGKRPVPRETLLAVLCLCLWAIERAKVSPPDPLVLAPVLHPMPDQQVLDQPR